MLRSLTLLLGLSLLVSSQGADAATKSGASQKYAPSHRVAKHSSRPKGTPSAARRRMMSARLVPPPPAYMPTILPEHYWHGSTIEDEEELEIEELAADGSVKVTQVKPKENPYAKYIYSRDNNIPKAVQARSGVSNYRSGVSNFR